MRCLAVLLLVAAGATADDDPLAQVVVPGAVRLAPIDWARYQGLGGTARLRAQGLDPATWVAEHADAAIEERALGWVAARGQIAGFAFDDRLAVKRRLATRLLEGKDARPLNLLLPRLGEEWARFEESVAEFEEELRTGVPASGREFPAWVDRNKPRLAKLQALLALRRSELEFHGWLAREVGTRFAKDPAAMDALAKGLASASPRVRLFCAEALARGGADAVVGAAISQEPDAAVAARMAALLDPRAELLAETRWQVRAAAIEAAGRGSTPEAIDFLRGRFLLEDGRLADDVRAALGEAAPLARNPRVEFFGIGSRSQRVLFCLDVSPSMAMPFNRQTNPAPRFDMARRELQRTIESLSADVRFGIVTFHGRPVRWRPGLVPARPDHKLAARALLDGLEFRVPGTNLFDAILECLDDLGPTEERFEADTIYVLSDGSPSVGPVIDTREVVAELLVRLQGRRVVVHTIGISTDQNAELLANLARVTGGRFVDFRD